jgi:hypothetical protein
VIGACCKHGRGEKNVQSFDERTKKRDHSEDRSVGGRMGSELILRRLAGGCSGLNWLRIAVVNAVMNFRVLSPRS